ncbi:MAG: hypothetical protein JSS02_23830 [Planctomycetes bacterium]|nr:hypothetical protein [Planctomycetota bacterium]
MQKAWGRVWHWSRQHVVGLLVAVWLSGSIFWFSLQAFTAYKFSQRLSLAVPAPFSMQQDAGELAGAMGLRSYPPVMLVCDVISPMLWGIGSRTRLLFPATLSSRLEHGSRATLLAHELAHFQRGDHWVRAFELLVTGLFWWHPVVWWARSQIGIAEEQCCDALVIEQFPETPRWYAEALLETVDFLSETPLVLPPAAAGAGYIPFLRQRLIAIMRGVAPAKMTAWAWSVVLIVALASLPWHFGSAQSVTRSAPVSGEPVTADSADRDQQLSLDTDVGDRFDQATHEQVSKLIEAAMEARATNQRDQLWASAQSPNGCFSVTRSGSNVVSFFDATSGSHLDLSPYRIVTVAFSPDSDYFATGGADHLIRFWSCRNRECLFSLGGHVASIQSLAFIPGSNDLISASADGILIRWDLSQPGQSTSTRCPHTPVNCLATSADGERLAVGIGSWMKADGGKIVVYNLKSQSIEKVLENSRPIGVLMFAADMKTLMAGNYEGQMTFWDLGMYRNLGTTLPKYKDAVAAARFSLNTRALTAITVDDIFDETKAQRPVTVTPQWFYNQVSRLPRPSQPLAQGVPVLPGIPSEAIVPQLMPVESEDPNLPQIRVTGERLPSQSTDSNSPMTQ